MGDCRGKLHELNLLKYAIILIQVDKNQRTEDLRQRTSAKGVGIISLGLSPRNQITRLHPAPTVRHQEPWKYNRP